jgi:hypothetical protein
MANSPSPEHEALHRIFARRRRLLLRLFPGADRLDPGGVEQISTDYTSPPQVLVRHGDTALRTGLLVDHGGEKCAVALEAQTSPVDKAARLRWVYYASFLAGKYQAAALLAVVTNDAAIARAARRPVEIGPAAWPWMRASVTVFGPDTEPVITDAAKDLDAAALAALVHGRSARIDAILEALHMALSTTDPKTAAELADFVGSGLGEPGAREKWRQLMTTSTFPYNTEWYRETRAEGRAEGSARSRAEDIAWVLGKRGITMPDADRERIISCRDDETLGRWRERMLTVTEISELFAD